MNFIEAIALMRNGRKVRRPTFHENNYLYFENHILMSAITKQRAYLCEGHFEADDWEVVEDKKTLSNKVITGFSGMIYYEKDVKEAIKDFINWIESEDAYESKPFDIKCKEKAKEIFGERLIG